MLLVVATTLICSLRTATIVIQSRPPRAPRALINRSRVYISGTSGCDRGRSRFDREMKFDRDPISIRAAVKDNERGAEQRKSRIAGGIANREALVKDTNRPVRLVRRYAALESHRINNSVPLERVRRLSKSTGWSMRSVGLGGWSVNV